MEDRSMSPWARALIGIVLALAAGLALFAPARAAGEAPVAANTDIDLWPAVTVLADPDHRLDAARALARRADFSPPDSPHANLGVRRDAVWMLVPLPAAAAGGRWMLDVDYASLDRIDVYVVDGLGRIVGPTVLGRALPFAQRAFASRSHAMPLEFAAGHPPELLLRVQTTSSMIVPVRLMKPEAYQAREQRVALIQGLCTGLALCLLAYALTHWVENREPMYLYYGVTTAGTAMFFFAYYGLASQYLWPASPWPTVNAAPLSVLVGIAGSMPLIERMLDVRSMSPRLARAMKAIAALAFALAVLFALDVLSYRQASLAGTVLGPMPMLLAVPVAWVRWRRGDEAARYIFAGWAVYAVGVAVMAALLRGAVDSDVWTQHAFQAGATFEMLMWLRVLGVRHDESRRRAVQADRERALMQALAHTDALTGLPNRRGLELELDAALGRAGGRGSLGVFLTDLDGFKAVNDSLGHAAGDELLVAVAARLRAQLRRSDVVARLGGDEFVLLARDLAGEADAWQLGRKLVDAFREPFELRGAACRVGLTVGFALAPDDGRDAGALLKRADAAMYAGKQSGKGRVLRGGESVALAGY